MEKKQCTSMACPYVAGLVGLMRSLNPKLKTKEVYKILNETGKQTKDTLNADPICAACCRL